jgi:hypothetical protein
MQPKVLGKTYLVAFCKSCGVGFRVREAPLLEGKEVKIDKPESHACRGCGHRAEYAPRELRIAKYQKEGLGLRKRRQG